MQSLFKELFKNKKMSKEMCTYPELAFHCLQANILNDDWKDPIVRNSVAVKM